MRAMTKNRAELLRLFFTNPDQSYYMQEIGRTLGKKPGNFQRVINNMEREGVLISERRANARYFKANKAYPLYDELKSIVFKTVGLAGSISKAIHKVGGVSHAFIYGSYAKAKDNYLSDIDLVLIGNCDEDKIIKELDRLEELLKREINYKLYTPAEFKKDIDQGEPFLLNILKGKKIPLIGGEYADIINRFSRMRRRRHDFIYDSKNHITTHEAKGSIETAKKLIDEIEVLVKMENPERDLL